MRHAARFMQVSNPQRAAELSAEDRRDTVADADEVDDAPVPAADVELGAEMLGGPSAPASNAVGARGVSAAPVFPVLTTIPQLCAYWRASPSCASMMGYPVGYRLLATELEKGGAGPDEGLRGAAAAVAGRDPPSGTLFFPQSSGIDVNAHRAADAAPVAGNLTGAYHSQGGARTPHSAGLPFDAHVRGRSTRLTGVSLVQAAWSSRRQRRSWRTATSLPSPCGSKRA